MSSPLRFSFSEYVTFIRKQGPGGCGSMASLSILGILKKREFAGFFTPDFSYAFAEYFYNDPQSGVYGDQMGVLEKYGCCSEVSMPSNFDRGPAPTPSPEQRAEALHFRIKDHGPEQTPDIGRIKDYLHTYGPVFASGHWAKPPTGEHDDGHVVAIIGYDDTVNGGQIEYQNSIGDRWVGGGLGTLPYSSLGNTSVYPHIDSIRWVENLPDPAPIFNVSARIEVSTTNQSPGLLKWYGRNVLTIKLAAEGNPELVVWDRHNAYFGVGPGLVSPGQIVHNCLHLFDDSQKLYIDAPLPSYAATLWPNISGRRWYLEVENHSSKEMSHFFPTVNASIDKFTFSRMSPRIQIPVLENPAPVPPGETTRVYLDTATPSGCTLSLTVVWAGEQKKASGRLVRNVHPGPGGFPSPFHVNGEKIVVRGVRYDSFHVPMAEGIAATCVTGADGKFNVGVSGDFKAYRAYCGTLTSLVATVP